MKFDGVTYEGMLSEGVGAGRPLKKEDLGAKEQRRLRACDSNQTTNGARTIDRGIPYTTNDVPGGPSSGVLRGTDGRDRLAGEDGEDRVFGLGGGDIVEGGICDDEMMSAGGMDSSENGDDTLHSGPGRDNISGDSGDDVNFGGGGADEVLLGSLGEDTIHGERATTSWKRRAETGMRFNAALGATVTPPIRWTPWPTTARKRRKSESSAPPERSLSRPATSQRKI